MSDGNEPFCSNCGYQLTGLTESSKCPECGKPIVEVLTREAAWRSAGKRYRSAKTVFGLPLIDVAIGAKDDEPRGRAKGIIAVGDIATGFLAIGGFARGGIAIGGMAVGVVSLGGLAVGLLACMGGMAVGGLAVGGGAAGVAACGGGAVGVIADGGAAYGHLARGGQAWGTYTITARGPSSPEATERLSRWDWLIGKRLGGMKLTVWAIVLLIGWSVLMGLAVAVGSVVESVGRARPREYR